MFYKLISVMICMIINKSLFWLRPSLIKYINQIKDSIYVPKKIQQMCVNRCPKKYSDREDDVDETTKADNEGS